jgi:excisionase family DNA binding protein
MQEREQQPSLALFLGEGKSVEDYLLADRRRHDFIGRHLPFTFADDRTCEPVRYELGDEWIDLMVLYDPGLGWEVTVLDQSSEDVDLSDVELDLKDRLRAALAVQPPPATRDFPGDALGDVLARLDRLEAAVARPEPSVESPYLTADEAAVYLRVNVNALYSLVERRKLAPLPGHRKYRFTRDMLDTYLKGE